MFMEVHGKHVLDLTIQKLMGGRSKNIRIKMRWQVLKIQKNMSIERNMNTMAGIL